jgi:hypothetical protein
MGGIMAARRTGAGKKVEKAVKSGDLAAPSVAGVALAASRKKKEQENLQIPK